MSQPWIPAAPPPVVKTSNVWNQSVVVSGIKVYGSAWVLKPVREWNGTTWAAKPLKFWDGSVWALSN